MRFYQMKDGGLINLENINAIHKVNDNDYVIFFEHHVYNQPVIHLDDNDVQKIKDYNDYFIY